jgi:hypothetical protein
MRRAIWRLRFLLTAIAVATSGGLVSACGAGGGNVYVGVGVIGPYGGYPGYYPPYGMIGRPPVYWEDEDDEDVDAVDADEEDSDVELQGAFNGAEGSF